MVAYCDRIPSASSPASSATIASMAESDRRWFPRAEPRPRNRRPAGRLGLWRGVRPRQRRDHRGSSRSLRPTRSTESLPPMPATWTSSAFPWAAGSSPAQSRLRDCRGLRPLLCDRWWRPNRRRVGARERLVISRGRRAGRELARFQAARLCVPPKRSPAASLRTHSAAARPPHSSGGDAMRSALRPLKSVGGEVEERAVLVTHLRRRLRCRRSWPRSPRRGRR